MAGAGELGPGERWPATEGRAEGLGAWPGVGSVLERGADCRPPGLCSKPHLPAAGTRRTLLNHVTTREFNDLNGFE